MVFPQRFFWVSLLTCVAIGLISGSDLATTILSATGAACCLAVAAMFALESIAVIRNGRSARAKINAEIEEVEAQTAAIYRETALLEISNAAAAAWRE